MHRHSHACRRSLCVPGVALGAFLIVTACVAEEQTPPPPSFESRLSQRADCDDIEFNVERLVPAWDAAAAQDSIAMLLDFATGRCPGSGLLLQLRILMAIDGRSFDESIYGSSIAERLIDIEVQRMQQRDALASTGPDPNSMQFEAWRRSRANALRE